MNKNNIIRAVIKYSIGFSIALMLFFGILSLNNYFTLTEYADKIKILADAFSVPGVVIFLFGVLVWLANLGSFRGLGYLTRHLIQMLIPFVKKNHEKYADYCERQKKVTGYYFLYIVGGVFLVPGIVFTILYMTL